MKTGLSVSATDPRAVLASILGESESRGLITRFSLTSPEASDARTVTALLAGSNTNADTHATVVVALLCHITVEQRHLVVCPPACISCGPRRCAYAATGTNLAQVGPSWPGYRYGLSHTLRGLGRPACPPRRGRRLYIWATDWCYHRRLPPGTRGPASFVQTDPVSRVSAASPDTILIRSGA